MAEVDQILIDAEAAGLTASVERDFFLDGPATESPSGASAAAIASLQSRGWEVRVN